MEQNLGILSHLYLRQADVDLQLLGSSRGTTGVAPVRACTFKLWLGERGFKAPKLSKPAILAAYQCSSQVTKPSC